MRIFSIFNLDYSPLFCSILRSKITFRSGISNIMHAPCVLTKGHEVLPRGSSSYSARHIQLLSPFLQQFFSIPTINFSILTMILASRTRPCILLPPPAWYQRLSWQATHGENGEISCEIGIPESCWPVKPASSRSARPFLPAMKLVATSVIPLQSSHRSHPG
jgi:hypothetical protein